MSTTTCRIRCLQESRLPTGSQRHTCQGHSGTSALREPVAAPGRSGPARPRDRPARRPGLPRAGRRAAVPARRRRDRRPPRHPGAGRAGHRRRRCCRPWSGCASSWPTAPPRRWPGSVGAGDRGGALAQGVDGLWLAVVIGVRRDGARRRCSPGRSSRLFGADDAVTGHADDVPADRLPRHHPAAADARRHRRPARSPGHPHPPRGRGRRQRAQRRPQRRCWSTGRLGLGHRRLRARLGARPDRLGRAPCSSW